MRTHTHPTREQHPTNTSNPHTRTQQTMIHRNLTQPRHITRHHTRIQPQTLPLERIRRQLDPRMRA
ncbi:hypothetical protein, partial [Streptomyces sp. SID8378]